MSLEESVVTPAPNRTRVPRGANQGGTPTRGNNHVHFDLASTNDPTEGLPTLRVAEQRKYDKLSQAAKTVITTQQPTGFRESTRSFAINMQSHSNYINSRRTNEVPFANNEASDTPFIPNNIKFKAKLEPSDNLKDNEKAKDIVADFKNDLQEAITKLTAHSYNLAKLETQNALDLRLKAFASGALDLTHERVLNIIKDKPKPRLPNTTEDNMTLNITARMLSGVTLVKIVWSSLSQRYCEDYLGFMKTEVVHAIAKEISMDEEKQRQIFDCTGILSLRPDTNVPSNEYIPQHSLNAYEQYIESTVRSDVIKDKWFEIITWESQKIINDQHEKTLENSRIIARRRASKKETATESTSEALSGEPVADIGTLHELVKKVQHEQASTKKEMLKQAQKKSLGGLRPQAKPGNNNKRNGQSQKESSTERSQKKKPKPTPKRGKPNSSDQTRKSKWKSKPKPPQGTKGKGNGMKRKQNPGGNSNARRNGKRRKKS